MDSQPTKADLEAVFHRLRAIPTNKTCFDCNAKNPTWSSVTYGVFICIDCSAVHRSLGVHLTFVRSTQLDTNWTWLQLRQMQLGGNANAMQFFSQHNCNTTDAQKKYNSRAANLYREKLAQAAQRSLETNKDLHVHAPEIEKPEEKEVDFFEAHENFEQATLSNTETITNKSRSSNEDNVNSLKNSNKNAVVSTEGPKVDFTAPAAEARKSTIISGRKAPAKKLGLGTKKGGLGATKVKTNFADLEREAELAEASRLKAAEESAKIAILTAKEREEREAAVRLAYKDLSSEQSKKEEQVRKQDPKKAEQVERLGMGINARSGISHSALNDMQVIEQENVQSTTSNTLSSLGKLLIAETATDYFDDYISGTGIYANNSQSLSQYRNNSGSTHAENSTGGSKDSWVIIDDPPEKPKSSFSQSSFAERTRERQTRHNTDSTSGTPSTDEAQKKFGNAKAISSDQYFNDGAMDYETKANLNRFQGSSSISSADFFGNSNDPNREMGGSNIPHYDLEDVKESVRQGVTKVAGKLGSIANGLMTSIQDRYGY